MVSRNREERLIVVRAPAAAYRTINHVSVGLHLSRHRKGLAFLFTSKMGRSQETAGLTSADVPMTSITCRQPTAKNAAFAWREGMMRSD